MEKNKTILQYQRYLKSLLKVYRPNIHVYYVFLLQSVVLSSGGERSNHPACSTLCMFNRTSLAIRTLWKYTNRFLYLKFRIQVSLIYTLHAFGLEWHHSDILSIDKSPWRIYKYIPFYPVWSQLYASFWDIWCLYIAVSLQ